MKTRLIATIGAFAVVLFAFIVDDYARRVSVTVIVPMDAPRNDIKIYRDGVHPPIIDLRRHKPEYEFRLDCGIDRRHIGIGRLGCQNTILATFVPRTRGAFFLDDFLLVSSSYGKNAGVTRRCHLFASRD